MSELDGGLQEMFSRRSLLTGATACAFASTWISTAVSAPDLTFSDLLDIVEAAEEPPIGSGSRLEVKSLIAAGELAEGAATSSSPKSSTGISAEAIRLIVAFEVSSKDAYNRKYTRPIWPHGNSGVTIGIGYDIGYVTKKRFREDWKVHITDAEITYLEAACGVRRIAARDMCVGLQDFSISFDPAFRQFSEEVLPSYIWDTENALSNTEKLVQRSPSCLGALVSLTYNRGASFGRSGDRYREMRAIRDHMAAQEFERIPEEIRRMKHIWQGDPNLRGLLVRREAEAKLFEYGLAKAA